jgi:hypothetical protein
MTIRMSLTDERLSQISQITQIRDRTDKMQTF